MSSRASHHADEKGVVQPSSSELFLLQARTHSPSQGTPEGPQVPGKVPCTYHLLKLCLDPQSTPKYCSSHTVSTPGPQSRQRNGKGPTETRALQAQSLWGNHSSVEGLLVTPHTWYKGACWSQGGREKGCRAHRCGSERPFFPLTMRTLLLRLNGNTSNPSERHALLNPPLGLRGGGGVCFPGALTS